MEYDVNDLGDGAPTALEAAGRELRLDADGQEPVTVIERPDYQRLGIIVDGDLVAYADAQLASDGTWIVVESGRCTEDGSTG